MLLYVIVYYGTLYGYYPIELTGSLRLDYWFLICDDVVLISALLPEPVHDHLPEYVPVPPGSSSSSSCVAG